LACLLVVAVAGCGGLGKLHSVEGKVTGVNIPEGIVQFHPEKKFSTNVEIRGDIKDGAYKMTTNGKPGVPEGKYKVTVTATALPAGQDPSKLIGGGAPNPTAPMAGAEKLVGDKFTLPESTPLSVTVPGGNYELAVTK
jgi:hypothetical protein